MTFKHLGNNRLETARLTAGKLGRHPGPGTGLSRYKQTQVGFGAADIAGQHTGRLLYRFGIRFGHGSDQMYE